MNCAENIGHLFVDSIPSNVRKHELTVHVEKYDIGYGNIHLDGEDFPYIRLAVTDKYLKDEYGDLSSLEKGSDLGMMN